MSEQQVARGEGRALPVWDVVVRVFHWSLVASFAVAYASAEVSDIAHEIAGYTVLALVAIRVVWGFIGSPHARFSDFVRTPRAVLAYLGALSRGEAPRYIGHNPAGGAMIVALLVAMLVIGISGHMMLTESFFGVAWVETLHATAVHATLILIVLHIAGVLVSSWLHRENLVLAMLTGRKRAPDIAPSEPPPALPANAPAAKGSARAGP